MTVTQRIIRQRLNGTYTVGIMKGEMTILLNQTLVKKNCPGSSIQNKLYFIQMSDLRM
jgi:hypothetical protein